MEIYLFIVVAVMLFLGGFVQGATGFGSALVAMPVLGEVLGLDLATPVFSAISCTIMFIIIPKYYRSLRFKAVLPVIISCAIGIPLGNYLAGIAPKQTVLIGLGIFLVLYSSITLANVVIPPVKHSGWGYFAGLCSGLISGAYNTGGPPLVMYGAAKEWPASQFKINLQAIFLVSNIVLNGNHLIQGNFTRPMLPLILVGIPSVLIGAFCGTKLDGRVSPEQFKRVVVFLLLIIGLRMIWNNL